MNTIMKINRIILISTFLLINLVFAHSARAQQPRTDLANKIQTQRIAFFTDRMGITSNEAQKFWPIYNEYYEKKVKLMAEKNRLTKFYKENSATMTENDVDVTINKYVQNTKAETALFEEYTKKFRQVLPANKVMKLYIAEVEFKSLLLKQIKERGMKNDDAE
jgi:thiamine kinase-like enzyme